MAAEGWGKKEIFTKGEKKRKGGGGGGGGSIHSDSESNMAGRLKDHKLITLARPNKMPVQQANYYMYLQLPFD